MQRCCLYCACVCAEAAPACAYGARRTARLDTAQLPPTELTQKLPASGCPGARLTQPPSENAQTSDVVCAHVVSGARHVFCARTCAHLIVARRRQGLIAAQQD
jgi:hypothetical protein